MVKIAVLGMGLMGKPMALKLAENGLQVIAYNRSSNKLQSLKEKNILITQNASEAIAFADCIILMLSNYQAINEVVLNDDVNLKDKTIIQMGTIAPQESKQLLNNIVARGGEYLEAPVLGSIPEVRQGNLLVMVGSNPEQFEQWQDFLTNFGNQPLLIGEVGKASALKLALNQMIAGLTSTFALSLSFIEQQQVDVNIFMDILRQSALYAPTFDKKLAKMCDRNFSNPNFPSKHLLKDIDLFLTSAQDLGLNTKMLEGIKAIVTETVKSNYANEDYSALIETIRAKKQE